MNNILSFYSIHPFLSLCIGIASIFIMIKIVRAAFRISLVAAIIGFILIVFFGYSPKEIMNQGEKFTSFSTSYIYDQIKPAIDNGLKNAHVKKGPNGTIEIIGDQFEIGETPEGKFVFNIKPLHLSLSQDELTKLLRQDEMKKLLHSIRDQNNPSV